ncbi:MAG: hypothetical protein AAFR24_13100 [Cyanobacteria bacterium J06627_3]
MIQQLHAQPTVRQPRRRSQKQSWRHSQRLLMAGWGLALLSLLFNIGSRLQATASDTNDRCQTIVQSSAVLSRRQLAELLTVPERSTQQLIKDIVAEPYCQMATIELRDSVTAQREAYPLAFAPRTWLVMLYEDNEYAGFSFSFQN